MPRRSAKRRSAPACRFVAKKSERLPATRLVFRTRDLEVRQRTRLINAIRGHLAGSGWIEPRGRRMWRGLQTAQVRRDVSGRFRKRPAPCSIDVRPARRIPSTARSQISKGVRAACSLGRSIARLHDESWQRPDLCHRNRALFTVGRGLVRGPGYRAAWLGLTPLQRYRR